MCLMLKSEAVTAQRRLRPRCTVDEKQRVGDVVFLFELAKKHFRDRRRSTRMEADVKDMVRYGIDGGVQPKLLVIDLNHRLIQCDVIR